MRWCGSFVVCVGVGWGACAVDAETKSLRHSEAEGRGIPYGGADVQQWTRKLKISVIQRGTKYPVESHMEELGSTLSLPWWNHLGDSSVAYGSL